MQISYDFGLSNAMWQRAARIRSFGNLVIRDASCEDIFIMKLIANRPGDAPDCSKLVLAELDLDVVYREIEAQYRKAGDAGQKIWITYIEEGIARLDDNDLMNYYRTLLFIILILIFCISLSPNLPELRRCCRANSAILCGKTGGRQEDRCDDCYYG